MELWKAAILGLVQGVTEYIPVSSKTHLALVPYFLGWQDPSLAFNVLIQLGTLVGIFIYFWRDLLAIARSVLVGLRLKQPLHDENARLGWLVVLATLPAVVFGLLFKKSVDHLIHIPRVGLCLLMVTALWLVAAERFGKQERDEHQTKLKDALAMGFAQVAALFPGISRSGSTIGAGMFAGLTRAASARFSFLMSIPVLVGAGVVQLRELMHDPHGLENEGAAIVVGGLTAAVSGYLVIRWLLDFVKHKPLWWFSVYCAAVSVFGLGYDIAVKGW